MRIVVTTTIDKSFIPLFYTWIALFLNSAEKSFQDHEIFLSIGCMPNVKEKSYGTMYRDLDIMLSQYKLSCTKLEVPSLDEISKKKQKLHVKNPNVRRILFLNGLSLTKKFDVIVYSDLDALFIRDPFPQLIQLHNQGYGIVASAGQAPGKTAIALGAAVCTGFFSVSNLDVILDWTKSGLFSQTEINEWVMQRKPVVAKTFNFNASGVIDLTIGSTETNNEKLYLLPYISHRRYNCDKHIDNIIIGHCQTAYYSPVSKEREFGHNGWLLYPASKKSSTSLSKSRMELVGAMESIVVAHSPVDVEMDYHFQNTNPHNASFTIVYHRINLNQGNGGNNKKSIGSIVRSSPNWRKIKLAFGTN
jgi:hypothetical protein